MVEHSPKILASEEKDTHTHTHTQKPHVCVWTEFVDLIRVFFYRREML